MQLTNLFNILPVGVVSKKFIGHLSMLRRSEEWSLFDAIQLPMANDRAAANAVNPAVADITNQV